MNDQRNALFELLPAYFRDVDARADGLLEEVTGVISRQATAVERDLAQMHADCFIETCADWVIPYIADLLGASVVEMGSGDAGASRRAVANLLASRRRRGSMAAVTGLAWDVAGWKADAREMYRLLAAMQHLDYVHDDRPGTIAIRSARQLEQIEPWGAALLGDVRDASPGDRSMPADVTGLALAVHRIRTFPLTGTRAYAIENRENAFTFSVLGNDAQLFDPGGPGPITRLALEWDAGPDDQSATADPQLYGLGKALTIWADGWPNRRPSAEERLQHIPASAIIPADLDQWAYKVPKGHVAVDPVLGRILFPLTQGPSRGATVRVAYHYGFAMEIGGGEYLRAPMPMPAHATHVRVHSREAGVPPDGEYDSIADAIADWRTKLGQQEDPDFIAEPDSHTAFPALVVELMESGLYSGALDIELRANESIWLIAAPLTRPVLWLSDAEAGAQDALNVRGRSGSRLVMDGVMVAGRGLRLAPVDEGDDRNSSDDDLCEVLLRHCTLVPGWGITHDCEPLRPADPSIVLDGSRLCLRVEKSIIGKIDMLISAVAGPPARITISDSIVDATARWRTAIGSADANVGYARLTIARSTIVGTVAVHMLELAENVIFNGEVIVARRQQGCVRYSYVPEGSRVPRQYRCQPAMAKSDVRPETSFDPDEAELRSRRLADVNLRIAPHFASLRYGSPEYLRLTICTPDEISRGASDGGEMGVYHDLFEPRRLDQLQARLIDHSPADFDSVVMFAS